MAGPRLRRLASDWESVRAEFSGHPNVYVEPVGPPPPEAYRVAFRVPGLVLNGDTPVQQEEHWCEIRLPLGYPREQPYCVPLTPIFHPNVNEHYCIADYWFAGQSIVDVISKIGEMIQYRIYNTKSPLNATAAYWADQHPELFPIGHVDLGVAEPQVAIRPRAEQTPVVVGENALSVTLKSEKE
jgi:ubiquitin-protein ligase